jgi:hypothetical protein
MLTTNSISDSGTNYNKGKETATVTFRIDRDKFFRFAMVK